MTTSTMEHSLNLATLIKAFLPALVVAAVALLTLILPAEYNIDLTGVDQRLGLTVLAQSADTPAGLAMAHSDNDLFRDNAGVQIAHKTVQQMTFKDFVGYPVGKLDDSWKSVKPDDIEVVEVGDGFYILRITQSKTKQSLSM